MRVVSCCVVDSGFIFTVLLPNIALLFLLLWYFSLFCGMEEGLQSGNSKMRIGKETWMDGWREGKGGYGIKSIDLINFMNGQTNKNSKTHHNNKQTIPFLILIVE